MKEYLLTVENLSLAHRDRFFQRQPEWVLQNLSFSILQNASVSIVGDSATGKSSLIMALLNLTPLYSGTIFFKGKNIAFFSKKEKTQYRRNLQPVFQNYEASLNPRLSVKNNLVHGFSNSLTSREKMEKCEYLLDMVGLSGGILAQHPDQLSGGEKQRISIVRALTTSPEILLLDEPFSSLDILNQEKLLTLFLQIKSTLGISYIFITHKLPLVKYFSDSVYRIRDGKLMEVTDLNQLQDR
ncbi:MAG: ABC transporter ATP-binding protein [Candidatus Marinimicrobia bacterium]|nr:ABC transporter ATP-binding protein [Candidatus Neomarinimicrobiota bacterium]